MAEIARTKDGWQARAVAWELLALSFRYPESTLAEAVASGEWADAAAEVADAMELEMPEGWLSLLGEKGWWLQGEGDVRAAAADPLAAPNSSDPSDSSDVPDASAPPDSKALLHVLRAEATRLFVGAPDPAVSPYEGVWRAADDGVQALLFVNPHSMDVERFCRTCGLGRPEGTNEPLDYVATECELLEYLALLAGGLATPAEGAPDSADLPGGSPPAAYAEFLREHAATWMPRFADKVTNETRLPFYHAAAMLLKAVVSA